MSVERVIVLAQSEDRQRVRVLSVDALGKNPKLMHPYGSGYSWATAIFNYVGVLIVLAGIAASFLWHWWAFIPGTFAGTIVLKATRQSTADFAAEILRDNKEAYGEFARLGLVWEAPSQSVMPER